MKTIILAGGLGTRLSEETDKKPKPKKLIEIYNVNLYDRDVFFLLASEFGMEYECVRADILQNNLKKIICKKI